MFTDKEINTVFKWYAIPFVVLTLLFAFAGACHAKEAIDIERLANAIYKAEGGAKTRHPYGILAHYKHTTPRQACINTIKSGLNRFAKSKECDFILFLSKTYCPTQGNSLTFLEKKYNIYWVKNVKYFYNKGV